MSTLAPLASLDRLRREPLQGRPLTFVVLIVWLAGALYCSGYERLLWGDASWAGSLVWSAVAVLPWLALFEWSKTPSGRRLSQTTGNLLLLLVGTAVASVLLELTTDALTGSQSRPISLLLLRRLPAIGACLLLMLWSRGSVHSARAEAPHESLAELAESIDWVAAADNYVELHIDGRIVMRRMTLRDADQTLRRHGFVRIHRRYLVNRERIRSVQPGGRRIVQLDSGDELPVGRAFEPNIP